MPFYRFEGREITRMTPHLSTGEGPIIEGDYIYFGKVYKDLGTGSQLHYHPNELIAFCLAGKLSVLAGRDRRMVRPGTFIHFPPYTRHQITATEDGPAIYLYIKDKTWTVVGVAADEPVPEHAPTVEEVSRIYAQGKWPGAEKNPQQAAARTEGLGNCYYPILEHLDAPLFSGGFHFRADGERIAFGFSEYPAKGEDFGDKSPHEHFAFVLKGEMDAQVGAENKRILPGGIIHVPKGSPYRFSVGQSGSVRLVSVWSKENLESAVPKD